MVGRLQWSEVGNLKKGRAFRRSPMCNAMALWALLAEGHGFIAGHQSAKRIIPTAHGSTASPYTATLSLIAFGTLLIVFRMRETI
jgi:hypothetical protein